MTVMRNVINLLAVLSTKKRVHRYFKLSNACCQSKRGVLRISCWSRWIVD